jgi:hypothetical protein
VEESIQKMNKEKSKVKSKMTKLTNSEKEVKFPVKDELMEKIITDSKSRPLLPLPVPQVQLESVLPEDAIHDAITVWNFFNSFQKQLSVVSISFDDFVELLKFSNWTSQALVDLFSAPLRLVLSDSVSANRLMATLPKKCHFMHRMSDNDGLAPEDDNGLDRSFSIPSNPVIAASTNFEDFDSQYNGLKLIPRKLKSEMVDSLRWSSVLRSVFLRLEPVRQLRKAVSEATIAIQYYYENSRAVLSSSSSEDNALVKTLQEINNNYLSSRSGGLLSVNKKISFETPSKVQSDSTDSKSTVKNLELNSLTMTRINTPKSKSRNKSSGLNKDAIFGITNNFISNLSEIYDAAKLLEAKELHELSPKQKLIVLKVLCDSCFDTERIQNLMEHNGEERANQIQTMNRLAKEQKAKLKEVGVAKREVALEACRRINKEKAGVKSVKSPGSGSKKKTQQKTNFDPTTEELSAMIDDLILLETYGVDTVREDLALEDVSDDEEAGEDEENGENRRQASSRSRAMSKQRSRAEKLQRNNMILATQERIAAALERNTERELKNALKFAERSDFKGTDEDGRVYCTESLKQVYKQLHELETRADEDKQASKHERALEEFFVRTEPLGGDRHRSVYWRFMAEENRLFVESKVLEENGGAVCPPSSSNPSDVVLNKLFLSRPNRYKTTWKVYSTPAEMWNLCEALDERGEREKSLKAAIKARYQMYQATGSDYIGRQIKRTFRRKVRFAYFVRNNLDF